MATTRALIYCLCAFVLAGACTLIIISIAMLLAYDLGRHDELSHMVDQAQHIEEKAPQ